MKAHFSVHPRYTPGSGAMVDQDIALRVAQQERDAFETAKTGIMGQAEQDKAYAEGLRGIVLYMVEAAKGWEVYDVCAGKWRFWPFEPKCPECGKKVEARRGVIQEHYRNISNYATVACCGQGKYMGHDLADRRPPEFAGKV